jgi:DNA-binding transcriptional LysR family regulator
MLVREPGSGTREVVEETLAKHGIRLTPILSLGSTEAIKRAVIAGMGVAIVSHLAVADELAAGKLRTITLHGMTLKRPFHVVQARDHTPTRATQAFLDLLPRL